MKYITLIQPAGYKMAMNAWHVTTWFA